MVCDITLIMLLLIVLVAIHIYDYSYLFLLKSGSYEIISKTIVPNENWFKLASITIKIKNKNKIINIPNTNKLLTIKVITTFDKETLVIPKIKYYRKQIIIYTKPPHFLQTAELDSLSLNLNQNRATRSVFFFVQKIPILLQPYTCPSRVGVPRRTRYKLVI